MITHKFKIGSEWKCRDGHRAVIVAINEQSIVVWHEKPIETAFHFFDGKRSSFVPEGDLISPWEEIR